MKCYSIFNCNNKKYLLLIYNTGELVKIFWNREFTTIDIGTSAIKVAKLKKIRSGVKVLDVGYSSLPENTLSNGMIHDSPIITSNLEILFKRMDYRPNQIVTTISNDNLIVRNIKFPGIMEPDELKDAFKWEADEYLPFPVEEAVLDYVIISEKGKEMNVVLVATKKDVIENFLTPFNNLNLKPQRINVQPLALLSLLKYQKQKFGLSVIIDIGSSGSRLIIGDDKGVYLFRTINNGGYDFTETIKNNFNLSFNEAEQYKISGGIDEESAVEDNEIDLDLMDVPDKPGEPGDLNNLLKKEINVLTYEISRSLDFFRRNNSDKTIEQVFITGGGSLMKGLKEMVANEIDFELKTIQPFENIEAENVELSEDEEFFSVVIGLGLSEVL